MTRILLAAACLAILLLATPRGAQVPSEPAHPTAPVPAFLGAPYVGGSLDPGNGSQAGSSSEGPSWQLPTTGGAPLRGWATWCAPKGDKCQGWDTAYLAAVPTFRWGDDPYWVRVTRADDPLVYTQALVVSFCACGDRRGSPTVIDLSVPAMRELHGIEEGVVAVTLTRLDGVPVGPTLPPTDLED